MMDTGRFDDQSAFPVMVSFWRAPLQPTVHKRHPTLNVALGTCVGTLSLDILRTLHLGVLQYWILRAVWYWVQSDVWATGMTRLVDRKRHSLKAMRSDFRDWYPAYEATKPSMGETVTRVNHLKESMIGTETRPTLKLKAAETKHLFPFVVDLVRRHADGLRADVHVDALIAACQTLLDYTDVLAREPRIVSEEAQKVCLQLCRRHLELCRRAGVYMMPKFHLWVHITEDMALKGNPRHYATYCDDSLNRDFARIEQYCHRETSERRLFAQYSIFSRNSDAAPISAWWWSKKETIS